MKKVIETTKCVLCGKEAKCWTGFLIRRKDWISAGFCSEAHIKKMEKKLEEGCFGVWNYKMGIRELEE